MSAIASRTFTQAFDDVRTLLRDQIKDRFTDTVLLGMGALVHGDLQNRYAAEDIPFGEIVDQTNFTYAANALTITVAGGVTDMYEPEEIWQRTDVNSDWIWVNNVRRLGPPPVQNPALLTAWEWSNGTINVTPCANIVLLLVRYSRQLAYPAASGLMTVEGFYYPLVRGVARDACYATKRLAEGDRFDGQYKEQAELAIIRAKRRQQGIPRRWGGYRGRGSRRGLSIPTQ